MSPVMFDVVQLGGYRLLVDLQICRQGILEIEDLARVLDPVEDKSGRRPVLERVDDLVSELGSRVSTNGDVVNFGESQPGIIQTELHGLRWESSPVLDSPDAFFFDCGDQVSIGNQTSR